MVAGDDFAAELLGQGEAETVAEGEREGDLVLPDLPPKSLVHVLTKNDANIQKTLYRPVSLCQSRCAQDVLEEFAHIDDMSVTDTPRLRQNILHNILAWLIAYQRK